MSALWLAAAMLVPAGDTVVIVLDNSGSMNYRMDGRPRIVAAQEALESVIDQTPADTTVGVLLINGRGGGTWAVPLDGAGDPEAAKRAIQDVRANGGTPLGASMKTAADALLAAREADPRGDHRLLIVSDGEAGDGPLVEAYLPQIQARGLAVDVIGVAMDNDHSLATRVATYRSAGDAAALEAAVADLVLGETAGDDGDAGASDFAMLEGLPNDVATAAVAALGNPTNTPLAVPERSGWFGGGGGNNAAPNGGGGGGGFGFSGLLTMFILFWVVRSIFSSLKRQHRASR